MRRLALRTSELNSDGPPGQIETLAKRHLSERPCRVLTVLGYFACPKAVKNWRSAQSNNDKGIINKLFASGHQDPAVRKKRRRAAIAGGVHATGVGAIKISGRSGDQSPTDLVLSRTDRQSPCACPSPRSPRKLASLTQSPASLGATTPAPLVADATS